MGFTFGSDPEFILTKNSFPKSAIGILPKKTSAIPFKGNFIYYDNVLAEIAIKPGRNKQEVIENTKISLTRLAEIIHPIKFDISCAEDYPDRELRHEEARIAGCNPEWDVYSLQCILPPEEVISKTPFRTAGGHIHLGASFLREPLSIFNTVRMMDLFIGVPAVFLDVDPMTKKRKKVYGQAGSHRVTDYGLEYRSLGNFWFASPEYMGLIYDLSDFVLNFVQDELHNKFWSVDDSLLDDEDPSKAYCCFGYDVELLKKCINSCDVDLAKKFMTFISHYLPNDIIKSIENLSSKRYLPNPYSAWGINNVSRFNRRI